MTEAYRRGYRKGFERGYEVATDRKVSTAMGYTVEEMKGLQPCHVCQHIHDSLCDCGCRR